MEIDKEIVAQAIKCTKNIACLTDKNYKLCTVSECISDEIHFLECVNINNCKYKSSFGFQVLCNCPVRKAIYNKYGY